MKLKIKLFDKTLPSPEYKSEKAAALDLYARQTTTIQPGEVGMVPLNIAMQLPKDHWVLMSARSSLHKKGVMMANGIGVGDEDYCGDNDEYRAALWNFTQQPVTIERGERIVQMIVMQREPVELEIVEKLDGKDRGGFGSTGSK
ncbi:dUTP diphosphatase [Patescibacteria group bacterium]|nr:dUTP diphosphatase [Patescibacteria group bacterium]